MKDKDYLSTLKSALLKSEPTVIKTELFGATVFIRRLTGDYLISYEEALLMEWSPPISCATVGR